MPKATAKQNDLLESIRIMINHNEKSACGIQEEINSFKSGLGGQIKTFVFKMEDRQGLLPNPDEDTDKDEPSDPTNHDPNGVTNLYNYVQSLRHKTEDLYHETVDVDALAICETWLGEPGSQLQPV